MLRRLDFWCGACALCWTASCASDPSSGEQAGAPSAAGVMEQAGTSAGVAGAVTSVGGAAEALGASGQGGGSGASVSGGSARGGDDGEAVAGNSGAAGGASPSGSAGSASAGFTGGGQGGGQGGTGQGGSGQGGGGSTSPRFTGRFDVSDPAAPVFAWSGTAISIRFAASAVGVTLADSGSNVFEVVLDGKLTVLTLQAGTQKYSLATGLAAGPHDLLLYRRSEASFGETTFKGFDLNAAAYLPATAPPTRRIEVIGDSISAGYGNEGTYPCQFGSATENQYLTYEAISARSLQAEIFTEAWSGIGMYRNYDGSTTATMPERYPRTLPERASSTWDFSRFTPAAVVINLGTNDFAKGDPGLAFQNAYTQFVKDLRGHYPAARFFLAVGPMLSADGYDKVTAYCKGVIATRAQAGDANLTLLPFGSQDIAQDGIGCDYHPSLKTDQKLADKMTAALKADLGW